MKVGVQFHGSVEAGQARRWFTHNWNPAHHVIWTVVPTTIQPGGPQLEWETRVERASATAITYWLTIRNIGAAKVDFEARYAIVS